jgi:hypothetical protein
MAANQMFAAVFILGVVGFVVGFYISFLLTEINQWEDSKSSSTDFQSFY